MSAAADVAKDDLERNRHICRRDAASGDRVKHARRHRRLDHHASPLIPGEMGSAHARKIKAGGTDKIAHGQRAQRHHADSVRHRGICPRNRTWSRRSGEAPAEWSKASGQVPMECISDELDRPTPRGRVRGWPRSSRSGRRRRRDEIDRNSEQDRPDRRGGRRGGHSLQQGTALRTIAKPTVQKATSVPRLKTKKDPRRASGP